jgi:hypothetical protein
MKMKKNLFIIIFLLYANTANSQVIISLIFGETLNTGKVEFGLDGGLTLSSIGGIDGAKHLTTWNLGFYFDIKLADPTWMLHTGVIVKSTMGTKNAPLYALNDVYLDSAFSGGSVTTRLQYFNVPIMLKYKFPNNIFIEAGIMSGLMHGAHDTFVNSVQDKDDLSYKREVRNKYHPLDAGFMIGAGYRLLGGNGMNLGIRYYHGLVDILIDDSSPNQYNRSLYVTLGIPIGAQKPAEDPE